MTLPPSKVIGCDFSGTVVACGRAVNGDGDGGSDSCSFAPGDRVAGVVHGCRYGHTGAFAEQLVADASLCFRVPERVPLERACTLGVGWISAAQALHQRLYSDDEHNNHEANSKDGDDTLLIYSAATNTGMHALQQARLERPNAFIVATAAPQHHPLLRRLGASAVFDYRSPSLVRDVRGLKRDITRALDCHSEGESTALAAQCMISDADDDEAVGAGATPLRRRRIIRTLPPSMMRGSVPETVRADEWILSYTALGKPFWFLFKHYPAVPEDHAAASRYMRRLPELLEAGAIEPVPYRLMEGGLAAIGSGFAEMQAGRVRGEKLVYRVGAEE